MEFEYSEKSKPLIIYEGYKFRFRKTLQNDVFAVSKIVNALRNYRRQI